MCAVIGPTFVVSAVLVFRKVEFPNFRRNSKSTLAFGKEEGVANVAILIAGQFSAKPAGTAAERGLWVHLLKRHLGLT